MKETIATLGLILFFAGSMVDISRSVFVTEGGTPGEHTSRWALWN
jgi:hypothetical protein